LPLARCSWASLGGSGPSSARHGWGGHGDPGVPFRPALLLLLSSHVGDSHAPHLATVAAALELGYLAALAHLSVEEETPSGGALDPANWGNMVAVVLGDFLLTKAYALSAQAGAEVSRLVAAALDQACQGRAAEHIGSFDPLQPETLHLDVLGRAMSPVLSLPCRIGALLSGADDTHVEALAAYGHHVGLAYRIADDAFQLQGTRPAWETPRWTSAGGSTPSGSCGPPAANVRDRSFGDSSPTLRWTMPQWRGRSSLCAQQTCSRGCST
jgi:menaquinone-9 beta-reductase